MNGRIEGHVWDVACTHCWQGSKRARLAKRVPRTWMRARRAASCADSACGARSTESGMWCTVGIVRSCTRSIEGLCLPPHDGSAARAAGAQATDRAAAPYPRGLGLCQRSGQSKDGLVSGAVPAGSGREQGSALLQRSEHTWLGVTLGVQQATLETQADRNGVPAPSPWPLPAARPHLPGPMSVCSGTVRRSTSLSLGAAARRGVGQHHRSVAWLDLHGAHECMGWHGPRG